MITSVNNATYPGGDTIEYDLHPDGQLQAAIANSDITTMFEYDVFGRRTTTNNPCTGRRQTILKRRGKCMSKPMPEARTSLTNTIPRACTPSAFMVLDGLPHSPTMLRLPLSRTVGAAHGCCYVVRDNLSNIIAVTVYFVAPYYSWQKGCIEDTNKLVRQYLPKNTDFNQVTDTRIKNTKKLKRRPREKLNFQTPKHEFFKHFT